jgi:hypothetical protein
MSEKNNETQNTTGETQLTDEGLESVSGGIDTGGCTEPFIPKPIIIDY